MHLILLPCFPPSDLYQYFLLLSNLFLKFSCVMDCISQVCTLAKKAEHIKHMNQIFLPVKKNRNTHLYIYLHLQVIYLDRCVPGLIFYRNTLRWLSFWEVCFQHLLESLGLARLPGIHSQRKHALSPSDSNESLWGVGAFQGRWWHKAELDFYIFDSASFRNYLLLRQIR